LTIRLFRLIPVLENTERLKNASDSLAGRIAIVEIGRLKMNEIRKMPLTPIYSLFEDELSTELLSEKIIQIPAAYYAYAH